MPLVGVSGSEAVSPNPLWFRLSVAANQDGVFVGEPYRAGVRGANAVDRPGVVAVHGAKNGAKNAFMGEDFLADQYFFDGLDSRFGVEELTGQTASHDRFYACGAGGFVELEGAVHHSVICQSQGGHIERDSVLDHLLDLACAVEEGELGMVVKVGKRYRHGGLLGD